MNNSELKNKPIQVEILEENKKKKKKKKRKKSSTSNKIVKYIPKVWCNNIFKAYITRHFLHLSANH